MRPRSNRRAAPSTEEVKVERSGKKQRTQRSTQQEPQPQHEEAAEEQIDDEEQLAGVGSEEDPKQLADYYRQMAEAAREKLNISATEFESLVRAVVRHVLFRQHSRHGEPIPHKELSEVVTKLTKKRASTAALLSAQQRLAHVFGLHLKEVHRRTAAAGRGGGGSAVMSQGGDTHAAAGAKVFLLRSLVPAQLRHEFLRDDESAPAHALAIMVLALIRVNSDRITEAELWRLLGQLGVQRDVCHPGFGGAKPEALLHTLVKQRYLVESRVQGGGEGESRQYEWGEHAADQFPGDAIDRWVKQVVGQDGNTNT